LMSFEFKGTDFLSILASSGRVGVVCNLLEVNV